MPDRPRIVIGDYLTDPSIEREVIGTAAEVVCLGAHATSELTGRLGEADVIIVFHEVRLTAELLHEARRARGAIRGGVGFDNIDTRVAGELGIVVCNVPDYGTEEVADHAITLLLAIARRLVPAVDSTRSGVWDVSVNTGAPRLRGRTLGIVGCGRIGTATAMRSKAFGMCVVFYDPYVARGYEKALGVDRAWTLEELLPQCDFLSLHCPLTDETRHMLDARTLRLLKRGAYVVNTGRGAVIDLPALIDVLDDGHLTAAALDVFETEPPTDERVRRHPRLIVTPHCAFYSVEAAVEIRTKSAQEALRLLRGEPPRNPVNREWLQNPRTCAGP